MPSSDKKKPATVSPPYTPGTYITLPIDVPFADPKNENLHSAEDVEMFRSLYETFGQQTPITIMPDGMVKKGHGWQSGMKLAGAKVIECRVSELEGPKADAYRIEDNASARRSQFDYKLLQVNAAELKEQGYPLTLLGFRPEEADVIEQARWIPPTLGEIPENGRPGSRALIKVEAEDMAVLTMALERAAAEAGIDNATPSQLVRFICEQWLKGEKPDA